MIQPIVLIVDDDKYIIDIVKKSLNNMNVSVIDAEDGYQALQILASEKVDILVADHKMPGMTGLELLEEVKVKYPETTKLLMTGQYKAEIFKEAINVGEIYKIITKPFNIEDLRRILNQAIEYHVSREINKEFIDKLEQEVKLFFHSFFNSGQAIIITDEEVSIKYANQAFLKLYGYELVEVIAEDIRDFLIEEAEEEKINEIIYSIKQNRLDWWRGELMNKHKDNTLIPVMNSIVPLHDKDNKISNFLFMSYDMTAQKQLENRLVKSEKKYRRIIHTAAEGIFQANFDGKMMMVNPAFKSLFQYKSTKKLKEKNLRKFFCHPEEVEKIFELIKKDKFLTNVEYRLKRKNNEEFVASLNLRMVRSRRQKPLYIQGFIRDISAEKQMREMSERMQRLEALGQLSAGLAHEIKNPVASIKLNMQFLQRKYKDDQFFQENISEVFEGINRVEKIMDQTLYFAGKKQPTLCEEDVEPLLNKSIELIIMELENRRVEIDVDCPENFPKLKLDKDQFLQVMVNLLKNAIQSIPNEGMINVRCVKRTLNNWSRAAIEVEDTGTGMSYEECQKIFNPFFTTKSTGVGLGLSIIQKILDQHNTIIDVSSKIGKGTKFSMIFPDSY